MLLGTGTFIEIGLRDITNNMRLDMRPFTENTTFTCCNMSSLPRDSIGVILRKTFELVQDGHFSVATPLTIFPIAEVETALRTMQQGKHRGKVVISFSDEANSQVPILFRAKDSMRLDPEATYFMVGGLGGLGRCLAGEFVSAGARNIAFLSRSGDGSPAAKALIAELGARGARARVYRGDVADEAALREALTKCSQELPPIKGVLQLAMVLHDTVFERMSKYLLVPVLSTSKQALAGTHTRQRMTSSSTPCVPRSRARGISTNALTTPGRSTSSSTSRPYLAFGVILARLPTHVAMLSLTD